MSKGLLGKLGDRFSTYLDQINDPRTHLQYPFAVGNLPSRTAGLFAGSFLDTMGAFTTTISPETSLGLLSKVIRTGMYSPAGQAAMKRWEKFEKDDPIKAQTVRDITNVALAFSPSRAAAGAGKDALKIIARQGVPKTNKAQQLVGLIPGLVNIGENFPTEVSGGPLGAGMDLARKIRGVEGPGPKRPKIDEQGEKIPGVKTRDPRSVANIIRGRDKILGSGLPYYGQLLPGKALSVGGEAIGAILPAIWGNINPKSVALQKATGLNARTLEEFQRLVREGKPIASSAQGALRLKMLMAASEAGTDKDGIRIPYFRLDQGKELWNSFYSHPINLLDGDIGNINSEVGRVVFEEVKDNPTVVKRHSEHIRDAWGLDPDLKTNIVKLRGNIADINEQTAGRGGSNTWVTQIWKEKDSNPLNINSYRDMLKEKEYTGVPELSDTQIMTELMTVGGAIDRDAAIRVTKFINKQRKDKRPRIIKRPFVVRQGELVDDIGIEIPLKSSEKVTIPEELIRKVLLKKRLLDGVKAINELNKTEEPDRESLINKAKELLNTFEGSTALDNLPKSRGLGHKPIKTTAKTKDNFATNAHKELEIYEALNALLENGGIKVKGVKAEEIDESGNRIRVDGPSPFHHKDTDSAISSWFVSLSKLKEAGAINNAITFDKENLYITATDMPDLGAIRGRTENQAGPVTKRGQKSEQFIVKLGDTQVIPITKIKNGSIRSKDGKALHKQTKEVVRTTAWSKGKTREDINKTVKESVEGMKNITPSPTDYLALMPYIYKGLFHYPAYGLKNRGDLDKENNIP